MGVDLDNRVRPEMWASLPVLLVGWPLFVLVWHSNAFLVGMGVAYVATFVTVWRARRWRAQRASRRS